MGARAGARARPGPEVEARERRPRFRPAARGFGPGRPGREGPRRARGCGGKAGSPYRREGTEVGSGFLPAPLARPSPRRRRGEGGVCEGGNFK